MPSISIFITISKHLHWIPLTTSRKIKKKPLFVPELFNAAVNDFSAKRSARCNRTYHKRNSSVVDCDIEWHHNVILVVDEINQLIKVEVLFICARKYSLKCSEMIRTAFIFNEVLFPYRFVNAITASECFRRVGSWIVTWKRTTPTAVPSVPECSTVWET